MSSIKNLYDLTKKNKQKGHSIVDQFKQEHQTLQQTLSNIQDQLNEVKISIQNLEALKNTQDQHKTLKTGFNSLVDTYNLTTSDIQGILLEVGDRMNIIESTLGI